MLSWLSDKLALKREICLWVVPPHDGKVRKYRFTLLRVLAASAFLFLVSLSIAFVAGDYLRLQLAKARLYLTLSELSGERDDLRSKNGTLSTQVQDLKSVNSRVLSYEQNLKSRLDELSTILDSAGALGLIDRKTFESERRLLETQKSTRRERVVGHGDGMGGAELDCEGVKGVSRCAPLVAKEISDASVADPRAMLRMPGRPGAQISQLERLDAFINLLRILPIGLPTLGYRETSGFGLRNSPFGGRLAMHEGVDFSLPIGSRVFATGDGVVRAVERNSTYGLMMDVPHNDRVITRYAHLSKVLVTEGQKVSRGTVIGLVGSSGRSTGPHLHYEVRVDNEPRNPIKFMDLAKRLKSFESLR